MTRVICNGLISAGVILLLVFGQPRPPAPRPHTERPCPPLAWDL